MLKNFLILYIRLCCSNFLDLFIFHIVGCWEGNWLAWELYGNLIATMVEKEFDLRWSFLEVLFMALWLLIKIWAFNNFVGVVWDLSFYLWTFVIKMIYGGIYWNLYMTIYLKNIWIIMNRLINLNFSIFFSYLKKK